MTDEISAMKQTAMDRIRDEMAKNAENEAVQTIGEYLTRILDMDNSTIIQALAADGKTIAGALGEMQKEAGKKRRTAGYVMIGPMEAAEIICRYYGIPAIDPGYVSEMVHAPACVHPARPADQGTTSGGAPQDNTRHDAPSTDENPQTSAETPAEDPADSLDLDVILGGLV